MSRDDNRRRPAPGPSAFICEHCALVVSPDPGGTAHRNHCPHCLWSVHLDLRPGDR
ncbi:MAG: RNHCP domain-containing protein, partial [Phycisphaerae bacterium]|nr:RNHCP domain-containing protein [Phycisphaerae bacterium]